MDINIYLNYILSSLLILEQIMAYCDKLKGSSTIQVIHYALCHSSCQKDKYENIPCLTYGTPRNSEEP